MSEAGKPAVGHVVMVAQAHRAQAKGSPEPGIVTDVYESGEDTVVNVTVFANLGPIGHATALWVAGADDTPDWLDDKADVEAPRAVAYFRSDALNTSDDARKAAKKAAEKVSA